MTKKIESLRRRQSFPWHQPPFPRKSTQHAYRANQEAAEQAAHLVELSLQNGADGFMFSVDEMTLSIL